MNKENFKLGDLQTGVHSQSARNRKTPSRFLSQARIGLIWVLIFSVGALDKRCMIGVLIRLGNRTEQPETI